MDLLKVPFTPDKKSSTKFRYVTGGPQVRSGVSALPMFLFQENLNLPLEKQESFHVAIFWAILKESTVFHIDGSF